MGRSTATHGNRKGSRRIRPYRETLKTIINMKLVIPMAGIGKRMRPHTLTVPKPLLPVAGKPMVQHLVEDICKMTGEKIDEIGFVIGNFGKEVEKNLLKVAENMGSKGKIFYQKEALGTAHAVLCAAEMLEGKVIVAF